jgi:uncharacterized protein (TIGR02466 family)
LGKIELKSLFSVPLFSSEIEGLATHRQGIIDRIHVLREAQTGMHRSNLRGWHSDNTLHQDPDDHMHWLFRQLLGFTTACARQLAGGKSPGEIVMEDAWANINPGGGWNMPHMHLPADWSGVCYMDVESDVFQEKGDGDLILLDPFPAGLRFGRGGTLNLRPATGMVLLFPSYLMHMVAPHRGDSERISIAFNCRVQSTGPDS